MRPCCCTYVTLTVHNSTVFIVCWVWFPKNVNNLPEFKQLWDKKKVISYLFLWNEKRLSSIFQLLIVAYFLWWNNFSYVSNFSGDESFMKAFTRKYGCCIRLAPHLCTCRSNISVVRPVLQSDLWLLRRVRSIVSVFPVFVKFLQNKHSR